MKKLKLISPIFLCLTSISILTGLFSLNSCSNIFQERLTEEVNLQLPDWPPQQDIENTYPDLLYWKIQVMQAGKTQTFCQTENNFKLTFEKNIPVAITAQPITQLEDGGKSNYFLPAGYIYPADYIQEGENIFSWETGFLADLMQKIISSQKETGISDSRLLKFLFSFNWKKARDTINTKIQDSLSDSENALYNPWQIDSCKLLDNLCYGSFKASLLNISGNYTYSLDSLFPNQELSPLSAFVPENDCLMQKNLISLKKEKAQLIADGHKNGIIFTPYSAKNLSRDYVYMPIYCEGL